MGVRGGAPVPALAGVVTGRSAFDVPAAWLAMVRAVRNLGRPGLCSMAISAVDITLWDLKAKLLCLPLAKLLGMVPQAASRSMEVVVLHPIPEPNNSQSSLEGGPKEGISRVKMKVGRDPLKDPERVEDGAEGDRGKENGIVR